LVLDPCCCSSDDNALSASGNSGGGSATRAGSGSRDAERRGLGLLVLRKAGLGCFSGSCSEDEGHGSSSSQIPGTFGGLDSRGTCGEFIVGFGFGMRLGGGLRARGEGGVEGVGDVVLISKDRRR